MEGGQLVEVALCHLQHSERYSRVEITQLWYSLSLVLVLYWDDFQTLFIILNAFLALLRRFLMSLHAPPSCLTVLLRYVNSSVVGRSSPFTMTGDGFDVQHHYLCLLLADLQAYLLCKGI